MPELINQRTKELSLSGGHHGMEVEGELRLVSALKLFETGCVSSTIAARLAGMSHDDFLYVGTRHDGSLFQQHRINLFADMDEEHSLPD